MTTSLPEMIAELRSAIALLQPDDCARDATQLRDEVLPVLGNWHRKVPATNSPKPSTSSPPSPTS
ncbi:MAG TPA: hypothetical protein VF444_01560 [Pseudonocardiaceae bacterium]